MKFPTQFDGKLWLSDRGIKQAVEVGLITHVDERYIQPATLDVRLAQSSGLGPFERRALYYEKPEISGTLEVVGDIKSSVRRNGIQAVHCPARGRFMLTNSSCQTYSIDKGESFGQLFVGGPADSIVKEFDHGYPLTTKKEVEHLLAEGYLKLSGSPEIFEGFIGLHVGERIFSRRIRVRGTDPLKNTQRFYSKSAFDSLEITREGFKLDWPNTYNISLHEEVEISPHVALQLFYVTRRLSVNYLDTNGVVDPGYSGGLCCQPQIDCERIVNRGDIIVLAKPIFYSDGVESPYGEGRGSCFQGTRC